MKREWKDFYATQLLTSNKTAIDPFGQKSDVGYLVNDNTTKRSYRALQAQGQWRPTSALYTGISYTYSRLRGNDLSETGPNATITNNALTLYYPEYLGYANRLPMGILPEDTPHRVRGWVGYDFKLGRAGVLSASVLESYQSGAPYSVIGSIDATGRTAGTKYDGLPANPGYTLSQIGTSHTYYFSKRGAFRADALRSTDFTLVYEIPFGRFAVRAQAFLTNVFNEHAITNPDTTVFTRRTSSSRGLSPFNPFTATPIECPADASAATCTSMGANYQKATTFGGAVGVNSYQTARTYSFATGVRF